jgi:5-methylcytosine-specific restriction enzyme A
MPSLPPHACATPGCPTLVPHGRARCPPCERRREQKRGSAAARGYNAEWRAYRKRYLAAHPLCVVCLAAGRTVASEVVDHIRAHKGDEQLFWDEKNHRAVCRPCHDARVDEGDFGRALPATPGVA